MQYKEQRFIRLNVSHRKEQDHSFYNCHFEKCTFEDIELREAEFDNCTFSSCVFRNLKHYFLKIIDCSFNKCLLQGVSFSGISFPHSFSLSECKLVYVDFISLSLQKTNLNMNEFRDCFFEECDLKKSNFSGSVFSSTEFRQTDISYCDFSETNGLDINHTINRFLKVKIPEEAGFRILKRMGITIV